MIDGLTMKELTELYQGKPHLTKALVKAMGEIKGIEKNSTVGRGTRQEYKAVQDKDVKEAVRKILINNGLTIVPAVIDEKTTHTQEEKQGYISNKVFVEAKVTFMIMHESGEAIPAQGIGHGQDPLDKAAGKATTYALKYFELYLFQVPTGDIDDAETTESQANDTKQQIPTQTPTANNKPQNQTPPAAQPNQAQKPKEEKKEESKGTRTAEVINEYLLASTDIADLTKRWNELTVEERKFGKEAKDKKKEEFKPAVK